MANRQYLHINKLEKLKSSMLADGWEELSPTNCFEAFRAKKGKQKVIIYQKIDAKEHLTIRNLDVKTVTAYLRKKGAPQ